MLMVDPSFNAGASFLRKVVGKGQNGAVPRL